MLFTVSVMAVSTDEELLCLMAMLGGGRSYVQPLNVTRDKEGEFKSVSHLMLVDLNSFTPGSFLCDTSPCCPLLGHALSAFSTHRPPESTSRNNEGSRLC